MSAYADDLQKQCQRLVYRTEQVRGVEKEHTTLGKLQALYRHDCALCHKVFGVNVTLSIDRLICVRGDEPYSWIDKTNFQFLCWPCNEEKGSQDMYLRALHWSKTMQEITNNLINCKDTGEVTIDFEAIKGQIYYDARSLGLITAKENGLQQKCCKDCKQWRDLKYFSLKNRVPHFFDLQYDYFYESTCSLCKHRQRRGKPCNICKKTIMQEDTEIGGHITIFQRMCNPDMIVSKEYAVSRNRKPYVHRRCETVSDAEKDAWAKVDALMPALQLKYAAMMIAWKSASPRARELALANPTDELRVINENFLRAKRHRERTFVNPFDKQWFLHDTVKYLWLNLKAVNADRRFRMSALDSIMELTENDDYGDAVKSTFDTIESRQQIRKRFMSIYNPQAVTKKAKMADDVAVFDFSSC